VKGSPPMAISEVHVADAGVLSMAYLDDGSSRGWPVVLSHGFPYDVHAYDDVVPLLVAQGARVVRPYLRGYGPTRFRSPTAPRVGQQAALGSDLYALLDALHLDAAILAGFDWGALSSCVTAALWPHRVTGLVSLASYDVIDVTAQRLPAPAIIESAWWHAHLLQSERGRAGLAASRRELCRVLWEQWSPTWQFDDATYARSAKSFDNPDFVDVVTNFYRFALGSVASDPAYSVLEKRLAARPPISVPSITYDALEDPLWPFGTDDQAHMFTGPHEHRKIAAGHNVPQQLPEAFADAVLTMHDWTRR
jgi:pimeloyl-ACP methyl ester carboxylesterase